MVMSVVARSGANPSPAMRSDTVLVMTPLRTYRCSTNPAMKLFLMVEPVIWTSLAPETKNVFEIDHEDWRAPTGAARGRGPAGGPSGRPSPTSPWLRSARAAARSRAPAVGTG